ATTLGLGETALAPDPWLPLAVISIEAIGLAAALQLSKAHAGEREAARSDEARGLRRLLDSGPFLVLRLDAAGVISEAFCGAPEDWDQGLVGRSFERM